MSRKHKKKKSGRDALWSFIRTLEAKFYTRAQINAEVRVWEQKRKKAKEASTVGQGKKKRPKPLPPGTRAQFESYEGSSFVGPALVLDQLINCKAKTSSP